MKIFKFHNTFDSRLLKDNPNTEVFFTSIEKVRNFIVNNIDHNLDNITILDAVLVNNKPTTDYWNIESRAVKTRQSFRMQLPLTDSDYAFCRYVVYYNGGTDTTYVVDVVELI